MRIKIQGLIFCTQLKPPSDVWLGKYASTLKGIGRTSCLLDLVGEYASVENVFCLVIIEQRTKRHYGSLFRMGLILARSKHDEEEYVRLGVWK